jgi:hypothetical protein
MARETLQVLGSRAEGHPTFWCHGDLCSIALTLELQRKLSELLLHLTLTTIFEILIRLSTIPITQPPFRNYSAS